MDDYSIRIAPGQEIGYRSHDNGGEFKMRSHQAHTGLPIYAPWSGDEHFIEWAQTCLLNEWVRYEGPRFSATIYVTQRPALLVGEPEGSED